jgi:hypothetical protein
LAECLNRAKTRKLNWHEAELILLAVHLGPRNLFTPSLVCSLGWCPQVANEELSLPQRPTHGTKRFALFCERPKISRRHSRKSVAPDRWRNSGGAKGASDLPNSGEGGKQHNTHSHTHPRM